MLGKSSSKRLLARRFASLALSFLLLFTSIAPYFLFNLKEACAASPTKLRPSARPVFVGTRGDIELNITVPGLAVKIEIPREFIPVSAENDTSFVWSSITEDYWYYNVTDERAHYPYDPNAPWYVIIWSWNLTGFTSNQIVRLRDMSAPGLAGLYNVTIYVATTLGFLRRPIYPSKPTDVKTMLVCQSRDWATIYGYVVDPDPGGGTIRTTKGIVYAFSVDRRRREARALLNFTTGFFNLTGLYPGRYYFEASAGYCPTTGYAYRLTNQSIMIPLGERQTMYLNMTVDRGARIRGSIIYQDTLNNNMPSLNHPWLVSLGYSAKGILNWTVELYDTGGRIIARDYDNTRNMVTGDPFFLTICKGWKNVGDDPTGTEFCGIGLGTYSLNAYVFAYVEKSSALPIQINQEGQDVTRDIYTVMGGVISGTIRFVQPGMMFIVLESPREAEFRVCGTGSGKIFGGHVVVEAYRILDWTLKGVFVRNGTLLDDTTSYADGQKIRFHILGFNEHYNRTYSGAWRKKDYGLEATTYNVKIRIRGYTQATNYNVTVPLGMNETLTVDLKAGGAIKTTLSSGIAWPGTMKLQTLTEWVFLRFSPHYRARIYHYDETGLDYGWVERIVALGQPGVTNQTLTATFSGMNHELCEVIYWGAIATVVSPHIYNLKAYTYAYLQSNLARVWVENFCASAQITLLVGCAFNVTGSLTRSGLFYKLVENVSYRGELYGSGGGLVGSEFGNATAPSGNIFITCRGYGGRGHFFFVMPGGYRQYDYGFTNGTYTLIIRRFGYLYRFDQVTVKGDFPSVGFGLGFVQKIPLLNKIYGTVYGLSDGVPLRLSWAAVTALAFSEVTTSMDGFYWLFMPDGSTSIRCSIPFYATWEVPIVIVGGGEVQLDFTLNPAPL